jgi:acetyltransferase-like isoleucine patch superfamily enzyme
MMIQYLKKLARMLRNSLVSKPVATNPGRDASWEVYKNYINVHPSAIIAPSATVKIFNPPEPPEICLEIGEGSHIFSSFALLRPQSKIKIGKNCQLGRSSFICADRIDVGDDVMIAWDITIIDSDTHSLEWEGRKSDVMQCYQDYLENPDNFIKNKDWASVPIQPVKLGNKSWIGFNAAILKGVEIGQNSVVGACSVVTKRVPDFAVVAGNPAKVIRNLDS